MGRGFIKIKDRYFEWSTVVDAPVTYAMTLDELKEYVREEYGNEGLEYLPPRLERVEKTGTSFVGETLKSVLSANRAGENEKRISADKIYQRYLKSETVTENAKSAGSEEAPTYNK